MRLLKPTLYKILFSIIITVFYFFLFVPFLNISWTPTTQCIKMAGGNVEGAKMLCMPSQPLIIPLSSYLRKLSYYRATGATVDIQAEFSLPLLLVAPLFLYSYLLCCLALVLYETLEVKNQKKKQMVSIIVLFVIPLAAVPLL